MRGIFVAITLLGVFACVVCHVIGIVTYRIKNGHHIDLLKLTEMASQGEKIAGFLRWNIRIAWLFGIAFLGILFFGRLRN